MTTTINIFEPALAGTAGTAAVVTPVEDTAQAFARRRLQALTGPRDRQPLKAEVPAVGGDALTATIRLYAPLDSWGMFFGVSAAEVAEVIDGLPSTVTEIRVLINSPGGEATEGLAIINLLRNHPAKTVGVVEGLAGSAAAFVAVSCDVTEMNPNSELVIHDAWGLSIGNAADLRETADTLDHLSDNLASICAAKAGGTVAEWRAVMAKDAWYSADEAVAAGLADSVTPAAPDAPKAQIDRTIFARRTPAAVPPLSATVPSPTPRPGQEGASDMDVTEIREALGLAEDTSDEAVLTAALDRLTEPDPPAPAPEPAAALPEGVVAISEAQLAQLTTDAQAGRDARQAQISAERTALVQAAITDGRIAPAERDAWLAKLEAGTGAEQVLAALKPGLIPVEQLGSGGAEDLDAEFAEFVAIYGKEA